jgi:hypothetical protein
MIYLIFCLAGSGWIFWGVLGGFVGFFRGLRGLGFGRLLLWAPRDPLKNLYPE